VARLFVDTAPLRDSRDFRLLFAGFLASMLGSQLTFVATSAQVYSVTNSQLWVGVLSGAQLPLLLGGSLWGGALGDHLDRRKLLIVTAVVLAVLSSAMAINTTVFHANIVALFVLAVVASGVAGFANPARNAAIPRLVKPDQLVAAYSINQIVIQTSTIVGPVVAGVLIGFTGYGACYWIDAGTFVVFAVATAAMNALPPLGVVIRTSSLRAIGDGFRYVRTHVIAQSVYLVDLNAMIFGMPNALFPAVATHWYHGGPLTLGLLYSAPGVGALLGAATTGWVERVKRRGRAVVLAVVVWGVAIAFFGLTHIAWLGLIFLAFAGWADVISAVLRNTILQSSITDEFRGRMSSIQMAVVQGGPRLGNLEAGSVASGVSTEFSIVSGGVLCVLGAVALARWRPQFWRESATG
jgi:MFS family permease